MKSSNRNQAIEIKQKGRWCVGASREGWSARDIQARRPSTTQSGRCALLGRPPHAMPSSPRPAPPSPPAGRHWPLHVWSGQALNTPAQAHAQRPMSTPSFSRSGHRRPLPRPDEPESFTTGIHTVLHSTAQCLWVPLVWLQSALICGDIIIQRYSVRWKLAGSREDSWRWLYVQRAHTR
jgi:hypothetical protein